MREKTSMNMFDGVANTLYVPLVARIYASRRFPEYFYDEKALEMEPLLPAGAEKGSYEYTHLASVARYHNFDQLIEAFIARNPACNVILLGAGLDTAYDRLTARNGVGETRWYAVDLSEVIHVRRRVLGERPQETCLAGDMFSMEWAAAVDATRPTILIAAGVFQYFNEPQVTAFVRALVSIFTASELVFDATSASGLAFTNWFIRRTGNAEAVMRFSVDDPEAFAHSTGTALLECRPFFTDARRQLGRRLTALTRVSMWWADSHRQTIIVRLRLG